MYIYKIPFIDAANACWQHVSAGQTPRGRRRPTRAAASSLLAMDFFPRAKDAPVMCGPISAPPLSPAGAPARVIVTGVIFSSFFTPAPSRSSSAEPFFLFLSLPPFSGFLLPGRNGPELSRNLRSDEGFRHSGRSSVFFDGSICIFARLCIISAPLHQRGSCFSCSAAQLFPFLQKGFIFRDLFLSRRHYRFFLRYLHHHYRHQLYLPFSFHYCHSYQRISTITQSSSPGHSPQIIFTIVILAVSVASCALASAVVFALMARDNCRLLR